MDQWSTLEILTESPLWVRIQLSRTSMDYRLQSPSRRSKERGGIQSALERSTSTRSRDLRILVRVATPLLIAGLGLGTFVEYRRAARDAERRFSEKQMYQARKAADRLEHVFSDVRTFLALVGDLQSGDARRDAHLLRRSVKSLAQDGALLAFQRDRSGDVVLASGDVSPPPGLLGHLPAPGGQGPGMRVSGPLRSVLAPSGWVLAASMPAPRQDRQTSLVQDRQTSVVLDWGELQRQIGEITKLSEDSYSWVLDHQGRLVMHPEHREQLGKSALVVGPTCSSCHTSFQLHEKMTRGLVGTGRIRVGSAEPKLVAYTPFAVGAQRWSLAIATAANVVVTQGLMSHISVFVLIGAIMLVMISGALLLDRESSRRIRLAEAFNRELERKVVERTDELRALYERLSALQSQQSRIDRATVVGEMASIVAHEIRTPLNALSINTQRIARLLRKDDAAQRLRAQDLLGSLQAEVQRISSLLEDHLLALVRHRRTRPESLDLNEQVMDALRFMGSEAARQGTRLVPELAPGEIPVRADPAKLRQILLNIVLNAIQALPGGGTVRISTREADDDRSATVSIQDDGPGIDSSTFGGAAGELEQLFRPFVTTKEDGTGLGLTICARLIKDMGGRITVRSKPGEGACFDVTLPVASDGED